MNELPSSQGESEDQIVDSIVNNKKPITFDEFEALGYDFLDYMDEVPGVFRYRLDYGKKTLVVTTDLRFNLLSTFLINSGDDKKESETTYLYKAAQRTMQEIANEQKRDLEYQLNTRDEKMREWADSKGREIFQWDNSEIYTEPPIGKRPQTKKFSGSKKFLGKRID